MKVHCGGSFMTRALKGGSPLSLLRSHRNAVTEPIMKVGRRFPHQTACILIMDCIAAKTERSTYLFLASCYIKCFLSFKYHCNVMQDDKNILKFTEQCVAKHVFGVPQIYIRCQILFFIILSPRVSEKRQRNDGNTREFSS